MRTGWWVALVVAVGACGGDDGDGVRAQIFVQDQGGMGGSVIGWFYDRAWDGVAVAPDPGSCRVDDYKVPRCDPACSDGQACSWQGTCEDPVTMIDVGTLTVSGTDGGDIVLEQDQFGWYELYQQNTLLASASHVDVAVSGSDQMDAFEVGLEVPEGNFLLDRATDPAWPALAAGQDLELTWGGADADSRVRVSLLDGGGTAQIWCEVPDSGSFTVPGDVISAFLDVAQWNGEGALSTVERYRQTEVAAGGGRVVLRLNRGSQFSIPPPG